MSLAFSSTPTYPTLLQRLGISWKVPTLTNPGSSSQTLLLPGPGCGSPAQGEGRAVDCSHVGGWVGKGLGWVPSYPAYPVKIAEAAALCIWVLLRSILFSLHP